MEIIIKIISVLGAISVALISSKYMIWKTSKRKRLDSIHELSDYIETKSDEKFYIGTLFSDITSIKMNHDDICHLMKNSNIIMIIYLMRKYPRSYKYENKKFQFANKFNDKSTQFISNWLPKISTTVFGIVLILSILVFSFTSNIQDKIVFGIYILVITPYLIMSINLNDDTKRAKELIEDI